MNTLDIFEVTLFEATLHQSHIVIEIKPPSLRINLMNPNAATPKQSPTLSESVAAEKYAYSDRRNLNSEHSFVTRKA